VIRRPSTNLEHSIIKKLALVLSLIFATATMAADMTCNAGAMEKKLPIVSGHETGYLIVIYVLDAHFQA
jgi:hypothetical protein